MNGSDILNFAQNTSIGVFAIYCMYRLYDKRLEAIIKRLDTLIDKVSGKGG